MVSPPLRGRCGVELGRPARSGWDGWWMLYVILLGQEADGGEPRPTEVA